jgi:hypothetical protein
MRICTPAGFSCSSRQSERRYVHSLRRTRRLIELRRNSHAEVRLAPRLPATRERGEDLLRDVVRLGLVPDDTARDAHNAAELGAIELVERSNRARR